MGLAPFGPTSTFGIGSNGIGGGIGACTQYFGQLWWSVFLQLLAIIGASFLWIIQLTQLNR